MKFSTAIEIILPTTPFTVLSAVSMFLFAIFVFNWLFLSGKGFHNIFAYDRQQFTNFRLKQRTLEATAYKLFSSEVSTECENLPLSNMTQYFGGARCKLNAGHFKVLPQPAILLF